MTNTEAEKLQSYPWGSSTFALGRKGSGGRERTGRRHLLTKDESESSDGSCSLTALRMASQGSVWKAQRDEDSSSLSGDAMGAQALGASQHAIIQAALQGTQGKVRGSWGQGSGAQGGVGREGCLFKAANDTVGDEYRLPDLPLGFPSGSTGSCSYQSLCPHSVCGARGAQKQLTPEEHGFDLRWSICMQIIFL